MLWQVFRDFRHGFRLLGRAPGFTATAALILALPTAPNTAVFSLVDTVWAQPRPGRIETLVEVFSHDRQRPDSYRDFSYPLYVDLRDRGAVFESVMAHTIGLGGIREGETTRRSFAEIVSSNYFSTLGVQLAAGRSFHSGGGAAGIQCVSSHCLVYGMAAARLRPRLHRQGRAGERGSVLDCWCGTERV